MHLVEGSGVLTLAESCVPTCQAPSEIAAPVDTPKQVADLLV